MLVETKSANVAEVDHASVRHPLWGRGVEAFVEIVRGSESRIGSLSHKCFVRRLLAIQEGNVIHVRNLAGIGIVCIETGILERMKYHSIPSVAPPARFNGTVTNGPANGNLRVQYFASRLAPNAKQQ